MAPSKNAGGRPARDIHIDNFKKVRQVQNASRRWLWRCDWCPETTDLIEGRDNALVKHLASCSHASPEERNRAITFLAQSTHQKGKTVFGVSSASLGAETPAGGIAASQLEEGGSQGDASGASEALTTPGGVVIAKKRKGETLKGWVDYPMTDAQVHEANLRLFRFVVSGNIAFLTVENEYFLEFIAYIRPAYEVPSRYVLSHSILDTEYATVKLADMEYLSNCKLLTYQTDGWEDSLRRSLYGHLAARMGDYPVVLALDDMTGGRGTAVNILASMERALASMGQEEAENFIALTTDSPTTMRAFHRLAKDKFPWLMTFCCWLHQSNSIVGEIASFSTAKKTAQKNTKVVSFFNGSHYWGGQLMEVATGERRLKQNCDTRWYALVLQAESIKKLRIPLSSVCLRPDAQKVTKGLSPVNKDVVQIVLRDENYWSNLDQLIIVTRPIVDMIGNLEARNCTLADCVLELLRCARTLAAISENEVDPAFLTHTRSVFQRRSIAMITPLHALCFFLHPLCRNLALSAELTSGFSLEFMLKTALGVMQHWRYRKDAALARQLKTDMHDYRLAHGPFADGKADALTYWRELPIDANIHPIKTLAIMLFSVVPHSAEVERLFSMLGGVQSAKRCNLSVETFEALGKCRAHYSRKQWDRDRAAGKPVHRTHAHAHTRETPGADAELIKKLDDMNVDVPFVVADDTAGPEDEAAALSQLEKDYKELEERGKEELQDVVVGLMDILANKLFNLALLDEVDRGEVVNPYNTAACDGRQGRTVGMPIGKGRAAARRRRAQGRLGP